MSIRSLATGLKAIASASDYSRRLPERGNADSVRLARVINKLLGTIEHRRAVNRARLAELADARDDAQTANGNQP